MIQVAICYVHLANLYIVVVLTVDILAVAAAQVESFPPVHTLPALKTIALNAVVEVSIPCYPTARGRFWAIFPFNSHPANYGFFRQQVASPVPDDSPVTDISIEGVSQESSLHSCAVLPLPIR